MGFFGKSSQPELPVESTKTTIISEGSYIKGDLKFSGSVHVDGEIEGTIICEKILTIGKTGKIIGTIQADKLIISGEVEGEVDCNVLEVLTGGKFRGDAQYNDIMIEHNGSVEGNLRTKKSKEPVKIKKKEPNKELAEGDKNFRLAEGV
jgi:cytoskeletal protein CcmA (bactofilin family)